MPTLDRSHPLLREVLFWFDAAARVGADPRGRDLVLGRTSASVGTWGAAGPGPRRVPAYRDSAAWANDTRLNADGSAGITAAAWCVRRSTTNGQYRGILGKNTYASETSNAGWGCNFRPPDATPGANSLQWNIQNNNGFASYGVTSTTTFAAGAEAFWAGTWDGSTSRLYVAGVEEANKSISAVGASTSGIMLGDPSSSEVDVTWAAVWGRTLSADEQKVLYRAARFQFRELYRADARRASVFVPAAAPPATNRRRRVLCGSR